MDDAVVDVAMTRRTFTGKMEPEPTPANNTTEPSGMTTFTLPPTPIYRTRATERRSTVSLGVTAAAMLAGFDDGMVFDEGTGMIFLIWRLAGCFQA